MKTRIVVKGKLTITTVLYIPPMIIYAVISPDGVDVSVLDVSAYPSVHTGGKGVINRAKNKIFVLEKNSSLDRLISL